jgi:flagellin
MALNINTNIGALGAAASASSAAKSMESAMERLSSGLRINTAADDAAGVSISTRMEAQIRGINQAIRNAGDGQALADTAEGAMTEITNMLQRMRELSVQASNDTYNLQDRTNLNSEMNQLKAEIDRIAASSTFNGQKLLDGSFASRTLQIGNEATQQLTFSIGNMSTTALGTALVNSGVSGVTGNVAQGTQAVTTVSQMAFNGNDSYGFTLTVGNGAGGTVALTVAGGAVVGNDAQDVADKLQTAINAAVTANPPTLKAGNITVQANGNVLTLKNNLGDSLAVSSFTSAANGSASYASISGAGTSRLLDNTAPVTTAGNSGGGAATTSTAPLVLQDGKDYSFRVNGSLINITKLGQVGGTSAADALTAIKTAIGATGAGSSVAALAGGTYTFTLSDTAGEDIAITNLTSPSSPLGSAGAMVMTVRVDGNTSTASNTFANGGNDTSAVGGTDIVQFSFTEAEADYAFKITGATGPKNYTIATASAGKTLQEALAITRDLINANTVAEKVVARVVDGKLELENTDTNVANTFTLDTFTSTGKAAVAAGTATLGGNDLIVPGTGTVTSGTPATPSQMTMQFSQDDRYSFRIGGAGGQTITAAVAGGDLSQMVAAVNAQSAQSNVTATIQNNVMVLKSASGAAISIDNYSSTGTGKVFVANAAGQGSSATLDDTLAVTGATTAAAGKAASTVMDLSLSATDKVTFKISDGRTNAVVRLTTWDPTNNAAMLAEINSALSNAGSDVTASTAGVGAKITLTNAKGGKIEITNYTSDATGVMTATPSTGQGVGKLLNDDGISGSQAAVSAVSVLDQASANAAVATIDRAFEQVNAQRSALGAISNRLDHTISNLTNISINTESAKSRIMDADFAAESTNLAKAQILQQASMAMLAQANASKQGVLSLLQG